MARFRKIRQRFYSFRRPFKRRRKSSNRSGKFGKIFKMKLFGIPMFIIMLPIALYFLVPSVKTFINEKIFKKQ